VSWVLILVSGLNARPPAVVGGYPTQESAEKAGELATRPIPGDKNSLEHYPGSTNGMDHYAEFVRFTVIPGAAVDGPVGCTHSQLERRPDDMSKIVRQTYRYVEDGK
jgi:hypothetical protein